LPERIKTDIVFTNGCFDVFHYGHLQLLRRAKQFADFLVVGINSDDSVRRLKGEGRPIFSLEYRSQILSSLIYVDGIVVFDEDTPLELIKKLRPRVLVKGGDWTEDSIVGASFVKGLGGRVEVIETVPGFSTSNIIEQNYKHQLLNLLAVIHRDGGHHTGEHGIDKSVEDAMEIVSNLMVK